MVPDGGRCGTTLLVSEGFAFFSSRLNLELEEVKPNDREKAKRVVYAVVYGVGTVMVYMYSGTSLM